IMPLALCTSVLGTLLAIYYLFIAFSRYDPHRNLHSFPTRRSSDLVHQPSSDTTTAFIARAKGKTLQFRAANADATELTDKETGSRWDAYGKCLSGPLKGSQLESLILEPEYWFAWSEFHPETKIYASVAPKD